MATRLMHLVYIIIYTHDVPLTTQLHSDQTNLTKTRLNTWQVHETGVTMAAAWEVIVNMWWDK